jgi:threonine dehydratase
LAPQPGELTFAINRRRLSGGYATTDQEALAAMAFAFRHLKIVLEPGGAAALAAVLSGRAELEGRTAVVVASGGNVDAEIYFEALG